MRRVGAATTARTVAQSDRRASRREPQIVIMEVTETLSDGLKREFQVKVPAPDLEARVSQRLDEIKGQVQLRGFRPGKVPVGHLRKLYGRSMMAEAIEAVIRELNSKIVEERGLQACHGAQGHAARAGNRGREGDWRTVRPRLHGGARGSAQDRARGLQGHHSRTAHDEVADSEIEEALGKIAEQNGPFAAKGEGAKVEKGDRVVVDFTGKLEGRPFEGGTGGDIGVNVGSNTFIPGFEDQLIGMAAGESGWST